MDIQISRLSDLPGYNFAIGAGYELYSHGANMMTAYYHNGKWGLDASFEDDEDGRVVAKLSFGHGVVIVGTAWFLLPGNFDLFERHIADAYSKLKG